MPIATSAWRPSSAETGNPQVYPSTERPTIWSAAGSMPASSSRSSSRTLSQRALPINLPPTSFETHVSVTSASTISRRDQIGVRERERPGHHAGDCQRPRFDRPHWGHGEAWCRCGRSRRSASRTARCRRRLRRPGWDRRQGTPGAAAAARRWSATSDRVASACPVVPIANAPAAVAPVASKKRRRSIGPRAPRRQRLLSVCRGRATQASRARAAAPARQQRDRGDQTAGDARRHRPPRCRAPAALRGIGADQSERRRAGDRQPPEPGEGDHAEGGGVQAEHDADAGQQRQLVVRPEPVDRQRLDRVGHAVDDSIADVQDRGLQAVACCARGSATASPAAAATRPATAPYVQRSQRFSSRVTPPVRSGADADCRNRENPGAPRAPNDRRGP